MSATTAARPTDDVEAPAGRSKKPLLVIVVLVLALGGGTWWFLRGSGGAEAEAAAPESGPVIELDPLTLNLADGRYLKLGLALEVTEDAAASHGGEELSGAKARDAAIGILGQRTYEQMLSPKSRAAAIDAVETEIKERYDGEVLDVYVTELVMQ